MDKDKIILVIGLGLIGGSYAQGLTQAGYHVYGLDTNAESLQYALENRIIEKGAAYDPELIAAAHYVIMALYPRRTVRWLFDHQYDFQPGTLITDTSGVKCGIVDKIQDFLRDDLEFIGSHPMAGKEVSGVKNSDPAIFHIANFILTPTERNTPKAIDFVTDLGRILGFSTITTLSIKKHDEMIGFVSQLTHAIAVSLMNCNDNTHLIDYVGDSFRDLTRIARINEKMWSELFFLNRDNLVREIDDFICELANMRHKLKNYDPQGLEELFVRSTERRSWFDQIDTDEHSD